MSSPLWYFAYGANTSTRVLDRRGIAPLSSEAARLDGWRFAFSMRGFPGVEPAFANIEPDAASCVHGVLHRMRASDLERLDRVEGFGYRHRDVEVVGIRSGSVTATAYACPRTVNGALPSRRYLSLVCDGAREHGLPQSWIAALEAQPRRHVPLLSDLVNSSMKTLEGARRLLLRGTRRGRR